MTGLCSVRKPALSSLPCGVSVPNPIADRGFWVAFDLIRLNVRRLMYQSLIFAAIAGDDPGRLRSTLDPENVNRLADPLIDRVRRNAEFGSDLL